MGVWVCSRSNDWIVFLHNSTNVQNCSPRNRRNYEDLTCDFTLVTEMLLVACTQWVPCSCKVCCAYHHNQQGIFTWYHGTGPHISQGCHAFHINNFVVMGSDQVLVQISRCQVTQCDDMSTIHAEADSIIVQQIAHITDNTFGCWGQFYCISVAKLLKTKQFSSCWPAMVSLIVNHLQKHGIWCGLLSWSE